MRTDTLFIFGEHAYHVSPSGEVTEHAGNSAQSVISDAGTFCGEKVSGNGASVRVCVDTTALTVERRKVPPFTSVPKARAGLRQVLLSQQVREMAVLGFSMPTTSKQSTQAASMAWVAYEADAQLKSLKESLIGFGHKVAGGWPLFALVQRLAMQAPKNANGAVVIILAHSYAAGAFVQNGAMVEFQHYHPGVDDRASRFREMIVEFYKTKHPNAALVLASPVVQWVQKEVPEWAEEATAATVCDVSRMVDVLSGLGHGSPENFYFDPAEEARKSAGQVLLGVSGLLLLIAAGVAASGYLIAKDTPKKVQQLEYMRTQADNDLAAAKARQDAIRQFEQNIVDPSSAGATGSVALLIAVKETIPENSLVASFGVDGRNFRVEMLWYPPVEISTVAAQGGPAGQGGAARRGSLESLRSGAPKLPPMQRLGAGGIAPNGAAIPVVSGGAQQAAEQLASKLTQRGFVSVVETGDASATKRWLNSTVISGKLP